jgi:hypothetical protein
MRAALRQSLKLPAVCTAGYVSSASSPTMRRTMQGNSVARPWRSKPRVGSRMCRVSNLGSHCLDPPRLRNKTTDLLLSVVVAQHVRAAPLLQTRRRGSRAILCGGGGCGCGGGAPAAGAAPEAVALARTRTPAAPRSHAARTCNRDFNTVLNIQQGFQYGP